MDVLTSVFLTRSQAVILVFLSGLINSILFLPIPPPTLFHNSNEYDMGSSTLLAEVDESQVVFSLLSSNNLVAAWILLYFSVASFLF